MARLADLCAQLAALVDQLEGCSGFVAGANRDFEGKSAGYPFGFTLDARDEAALAGYAEDRTHKAIGAQLVAFCIGGAEGIRVYDLEMRG